MKRLLAYLFIVLGLGSVFSVSVKAEIKSILCHPENIKWKCATEWTDHPKSISSIHAYVVFKDKKNTKEFFSVGGPYKIQDSNSFKSETIERIKEATDKCKNFALNNNFNTNKCKSPRTLINLKWKRYGSDYFNKRIFYKPDQYSSDRFANEAWNLVNLSQKITKAEPSQTQPDINLEEEKKKIAEEKKKIEEEKRKIAEAKKKQQEEKKRKEQQDEIYVIGSGTGFFVNKEGHVITNNHVVEICKIMAAKIGGKAKLFEILATDTSNDLAIIKGEFKSKNYLNLSTVGAVFGEDVVAFGYPLDSELSSSVKLTRGIVSSLSGPENNISQIQIDAAIQPGNSGGPVLNYQGQVVGVASAGLNKLYMLEKAEYIPENVNFAVAAPTLLAFLKANQIDFGDKQINVDKTQELAKIGMPSTIQLKCLNTKSAHQKYLKNKKYNDVLLRKVVDFDQELLK